MLIHVLASSFSDIANITLSVDGQAVTLDADGRATVRATAPGKLNLVATATDIDGFTGTLNYTLKVRDPADRSAPVVAFTAETAYALISQPIDLAGQVADSNLDSWALQIARAGTDQYTVLAQGNGPIDGTLAQLDPNAWVNGVYDLKLTATDIAGRTGEAKTVLQIASTKNNFPSPSEPVNFFDFHYCEYPADIFC